MRLSLKCIEYVLRRTTLEKLMALSAFINTELDRRRIALGLPTREDEPYDYDDCCDEDAGTRREEE